jgi:hypothetical protein
MPTTPIYALPYPAATDPADVPLDMQELAEAVEARQAGKELAYVEPTPGAISIPIVAQASAVTIVAAPSVTYEAKPILIEFFSVYVYAGGAGAQTILNLWDGAADLGFIAQVLGVGGATNFTISCCRRLTPTAGAHTYSIRGWASGIAGSVSGGSGGRLPGFIRISRI